ncbi:hypothetical protein SANTM175S_06106 [Streptomyces antimycoticus]
MVGRLSDRHGIRVQLRPSGEQDGTTSLVMLPDAIAHSGGGERRPARRVHLSQIIPEQNFQGGESFGQVGQPMRTAAELGFDDSRYAEIPDTAALRRARPGRPLADARGAPGGPGGPVAARAAVAADQGDGRNTEAAGFQDQFTGQQPGYDPPATAARSSTTAGTDQQQAYADQQQAYQEPQQASYDEQYYAPNGGLPGNEGYSSNGGYPDPSYAQPGPNGQQQAGPGAQENYSPSSSGATRTTGRSRTASRTVIRPVPHRCPAGAFRRGR